MSALLNHNMIHACIHFTMKSKLVSAHWSLVSQYKYFILQSCHFEECSENRAILSFSVKLWIVWWHLSGSSCMAVKVSSVCVATPNACCVSRAFSSVSRGLSVSLTESPRSHKEWQCKSLSCSSVAPCFQSLLFSVASLVEKCTCMGFTLRCEVGNQSGLSWSHRLVGLLNMKCLEHMRSFITTLSVN